MQRVLLIRPLCGNDEPEFAEPLGIERLAGFLRSHGIEDVTVADRRLYEEERRRGVNTSTFWQDIRSIYERRGPTHVGLSLMTVTDVPDALRVMSRLRAYHPHALFFVGGVYVTTSTDEALRHMPRDVHLIRNEGEYQLLEWVRGNSPSNVVLSPNDWAPAYRPNITRYAALGCAVNLQSSRGCPGACTFCATPTLPASYRMWQPRDMRLVVDEVSNEAGRLIDAGLLPIFNFVDDDFGPLSRVEEFASSLVERDLRISFALEMRMAALTGQTQLAERLQALRHAGLTRVFVGVESLNPNTLREWHKSYDVSKLSLVVRAFGQAGVDLQPGYILWHGGQTVASAMNEVQTLWQLGIYSHRAAISRLIAFSGCKLDEGAAKLGDAQTFYDEFVAHTDDLMHTWVESAIKEPYVAAAAHLTGKNAVLRTLRKTLSEVNERSYRSFMEAAEAYVRMSSQITSQDKCPNEVLGG